ncbi:dihydroorotase [Temperatibacter marinus]|uniref:Dihydroorotase n=1 Tax=Temperatibacter marinus TaxID=1456591 RepID=A0AA52ECX8_9PROT|nr:dihydroorotase [Temperatibacter marinus]WND02461.1 dihydroorotase [Temperatibacter marinus]
MTLTAYVNARLIDPKSKMDIPGSLLINGSLIAALGENIDIPESAEIIDCKGKVLSPGFIDMRAFSVDWEAAAAGGITTVILQPDQTTLIDNDAAVERIRARAKERATVNVIPMGTATKAMDGQEITEIGQMLESGAVAFTDCRKPVEDAQILKRLMEYASYYDALIVQFAEEQSLKADGIAHDGGIASRLGLTGIPSIAEQIQIERDARLAEHTNSRLHVALVSSREGVEAVREAKARGVKITCSIAPHYLHLNEHALEGYPTFAKVSPPFRTEEDRLALLAALADGTVDTIVSDHDPKNPDLKRLPFGQAASGVSGYETLLPLSLKPVQEGTMSLLDLIAKLTSGPASLLKLDSGHLSIGAQADLTIFDPEQPWIIKRNQLKASATNTPFDTLPVNGKVWKTIVAGHEIYSA